jgi:hypothetical protein
LLFVQTVNDIIKYYLNEDTQNILDRKSLLSIAASDSLRKIYYSFEVDGQPIPDTGAAKVSKDNSNPIVSQILHLNQGNVYSLDLKEALETLTNRINGG